MNKYQVTIHFKDGTKKKLRPQENYSLACRQVNNAWYDFDNVIKSELKEVK